jgi:hypothetical protein
VRRGQRVGEVALPVASAAELDCRPGEILLRRHEVEIRKPRRLRELAQRRAVEQVDAGGAVCALAEAGRGVRLRVEIDDERALAGLREARGDVDRGRRLTDAALLIRDREHACAHGSSLRAATDVSSAANGDCPRELARADVASGTKV